MTDLPSPHIYEYGTCSVSSHHLELKTELPLIFSLSATNKTLIDLLTKVILNVTVHSIEVTFVSVPCGTFFLSNKFLSTRTLKKSGENDWTLTIQAPSNHYPQTMITSPNLLRRPIRPICCISNLTRLDIPSISPFQLVGWRRGRSKIGRIRLTSIAHRMCLNFRDLALAISEGCCCCGVFVKG